MMGKRKYLLIFFMIGLLGCFVLLWHILNSFFDYLNGV